eukprot:6056945-Amphidinium_carterae.1
MKDLKDKTPFDINKRCSRVRWVTGANCKLREYCYPEYNVIPRDLPYWCYVCLKGPGRDVSLARCAACDVFMCMDH